MKRKCSRKSFFILIGKSLFDWDWRGWDCSVDDAFDSAFLTLHLFLFSKYYSLYKLVQPKGVLYLAVDGVAPRAKMNQQRSRRFRSAKEAEQLASEILAREGALPDAKRFDSNCITPGTDFMLKLSLALHKWVEFKLETDPLWKTGAHVVVSGPDVPGEGEHKVMDFLREEREKFEKGDESALYKPDQVHVLYGLDADLIMLGLVTHEPHFMLLREKMSVVMAGRGRNKNRKKKDMLEYNQYDFELLQLQALRELLSVQFRKFQDVLEEYDLERVISDFVAMCMLVGNDFLPHVPHMEIDNGAISLMMSSYIELLPKWGGYLTKKEKIHPERWEEFVYRLALFEEEHFKRRGFEENEPGWKLPSSEEQDPVHDFYGEYYTGEPTPEVCKSANQKGSEPPPSKEPTGRVQLTDNEAFRRRYPDDTSRSYRDFYYNFKLGWKRHDVERTAWQRRAHVRDYMEGLHWNLHYYHNGCKSWDWFFPHLYAPLATDFVNLSEFYDEVDEEGYAVFDFDDGITFPPLAQLLSVLPPQSAALLPQPLGELMKDPASPLIEYYPPDFTSDANGKRQPWESVVQIPFIESATLLDTVQVILNADEAADEDNKLLSNAERRRNAPGASKVYFAPEQEQDRELIVAQQRERGRRPEFSLGEREDPRRGGGRGRGRGGRSRGRGGGRGRGRGRY